jgi:hypothetical protein
MYVYEAQNYGFFLITSKIGRFIRYYKMLTKKTAFAYRLYPLYFVTLRLIVRLIETDS